MVKPLIVRSVAGTFSFTFLAVGLMTLPMSVFTMLFNCTPFFTAFLASYYLKESLTWIEIVAMIGSFGGICLIAFGVPDEEDQQTGSMNTLFDEMTPTFRSLLGIGCTFCTAMSMSVFNITTRMMKGLHWSIIQFNFTLCACIVVGIILLA
jgi:drug/metabolite transporter (DMT)-like permease